MPSRCSRQEAGWHVDSIQTQGPKLGDSFPALSSQAAMLLTPGPGEPVPDNPISRAASAYQLAEQERRGARPLPPAHASP